MCDKLDVHVVTTGATWSNGLVERHHTLISRNVKNIIEEAFAWAVNAKNSLSNINGFSPGPYHYQLLELGINPIMPSASLDNPYEHPTTLEEKTPSERVASNTSQETTDGCRSR